MKENERGGKFRNHGRNENVYERLILEPEGKDGFRGACGKTTLKRSLKK
jgi:hypothetical protein